MHRREVIVAAALGGLAGCVGGGDDSDDATDTERETTPEPETATETPTDTATPTATEDGTASATPTREPLVGRETETGTPSAEEFLADVSNYEGIEGHTDSSEVTVSVGVETETGYYGFGPPAIRVSTGTTVTWEWTGQGYQHDVTATYGGDFESELAAEEGHTFSHTFEETGTALYVCTPHQGLGMKGAVIVE